MSTTQRSNLIYPTVLQEEVVKGIAGMQIFGGSRAVVLNPSLQNGRNRVGADVTVPYFDSIGKAQLIPDGGAVTPKRLAMSSESAVVIHLGDAVSINTLAGMATQGRDPYQVARDMLLAGLAAKLEDIIVQRLAARAVSASMVYDGSSGNVSVAAINGTMQKFGDELVKPAPALWFAKSNVMWDISGLSDAMGRPLYVQNTSGIPSMLGPVPLVMSDKPDLVLGTSPETYYTMLVKEGAVAVWMDPAVTIEEDRDSLADDDLLVMHAYMLVHAYGCMAGGTKAGVAAMKTRAST